MRNVLASALLVGSTGTWAFDNKLCGYDIGDGYLGQYYSTIFEDQRKKIEPYGDRVRLAVSRTATTLTIKPKRGKPKAFKGIPCDGSDQPSFEGYMPTPGWFIVHVVGGESYKIHLIDEELGRETVIPNVSLPVVSPDAKHFAVFGTNYAHSHNELQVWRITANGPKKIWADEPKDVHHYSVAWKSDSHLTVVFHPDGEDIAGNAPPFTRPKPKLIVDGIRITYTRRPKSE